MIAKLAHIISITMVYDTYNTTTIVFMGFIKPQHISIKKIVVKPGIMFPRSSQ